MGRREKGGRGRGGGRSRNCQRYWCLESNINRPLARCTRETDLIAPKLVRCGIASEAAAAKSATKFSRFFLKNSRSRRHYQRRAEYGAHLLSDFLFPHVVSQVFIIRVHDVGHGIEVSDWLATSMSNGTAMKLWNLSLVLKAWPYKPWLRVGVRWRETYLFWGLFVWRYCFDVPEICTSLCPKQGICKNRGPHITNNKIASPSLIMDVCLVFACLAMCIVANHFRVWSWKPDDIPSFLNVHIHVFAGSFVWSWMEYYDVPMLFGHAFVIICGFFDQVESWCLTVPSLFWNVVQSGTLRVNVLCWGWGHFSEYGCFPLQFGRVSGWRNTVAEYSCRPQWGPATPSVRHRVGHFKTLTWACPWRFDVRLDSEFVCVRDFVGLMLQRLRFAEYAKTVNPINFQLVWLTERPIETWYICHCGWWSVCPFLVRLRTIHIRHDSVHAHCRTRLWKLILGKHEKTQWTCFEQIIHNNDPGPRFWNNRTGTRFPSCVSTHGGRMHRFHLSTTPRHSPSRIDFSILFTWWTSKGRTYHKIKGSNLLREKTTLWNWPKMLSHDANSMRPSSHITSAALKGKIFTEFRASTGNNLWDFFGILL